MPPLEADGNWNGQEGALKITGDKPTIKFVGGAAAGNQSWLVHVGSDGGGSFQLFKQGGNPTAWDNVMTIDPTGVVGIGTSTPRARANGKLVSVASVGPAVSAVVGLNDVADAASAGNGAWFESAQGEGVRGWSKNSAHGGVVGVNTGGGVAVYGTSNGVAVYGTSSVGGTGGLFESERGEGVRGLAKGPDHGGVVGINTGGGVGVYGQGRLAGFFEGDVEVTGDIRLRNADCAEEFPSAECGNADPGTVVVLGTGGSVTQSKEAYDKRVAGVISGAGLYRPGVILDTHSNRSERRPVALLGKVYCKVDATHGAIEVGDLLTTSPTPGHAMKASDPAKAFGAVLGKSLKPFSSGCGLIPILVALQ